jgi:hypothetical protein
MLPSIKIEQFTHFTIKGVRMENELNGQEPEVKVDPSELSPDKTPAELPEDAKERTKVEFEKLKEHNRQLAEENALLKAQTPKQSVLDNLLPNGGVQTVAPNLNQQQVDDIVKGLVDENGYIDQALLENTLRQANQQVAEANKKAETATSIANQALSQVNKFGQDREVRIAHKKFPNVDPESPKYDPIFFKKVKNELLGAMYEGRKLSFVDACRDVAVTYSPNAQAVKVKAVEEYKETVAQKNSLNPTGSSRPDVRTSKEDLIEGTRKGDAASIAARLANI